MGNYWREIEIKGIREEEVVEDIESKPNEQKQKKHFNDQKSAQ